MQAVILAGGRGTRLKPFTEAIPKPLVPLDGMPIIEVLLRRMKKSGVTDVIVCVNHLAHLIEEALKDGSAFGLNIRYSHETQPLSTVGPLKLIRDLNDNFLVANGDILTTLDMSELFENHLKSGAQVTVATHRRIGKIDYGVLEVDVDGKVVSFEEKPIFDVQVSMGIYVFSKSVLDLVPDDEPFGFDQLMLRMLEKDRQINTFPFDGYWMDIGRPDDYRHAIEDMARLPWKWDNGRV